MSKCITVVVNMDISLYGYMPVYDVCVLYMRSHIRMCCVCVGYAIHLYTFGTKSIMVYAVSALLDYTATAVYTLYGHTYRVVSCDLNLHYSLLCVFYCY